MPEDWVDREALQRNLAVYFQQNKKGLSQFGSRVNQVFEAFVFAQVVGWHRDRDWIVEFVHPQAARPKNQQAGPIAQPQELVLKFSTRGQPSNYSYAKCTKENEVRQVRHALRVSTRAGKIFGVVSANLVLDVSVVRDIDLSGFSTETPVPNEHLVTFGEAKHMSAFAELVASFLGMVAELQPERIGAHEANDANTDELWPFLFVSGFLRGTARGIVDTVERRKYAVKVYSRTEQLTAAVKLPTDSPDNIKARNDVGIDGQQADASLRDEIPF